MSDKARHYFVYGNTAQGFVSKLDSNLIGIEKLYILQGRPGMGKLLLTEGIADVCAKSGSPPEYLHCPSAPGTYDGILLPGLGLAVLDGTDLHAVRSPLTAPDALYIDAESVFDRTGLGRAGEKAAALFRRIEASHEKAFEHFLTALRIHDEWEKIYIENMDFEAADAVTAETADRLLGRHRRDKPSVIKHRFFGASTPSGALDFIESLTGSLSKRYLLKGRPGTGKSTLLRKLAAETAGRGLDAEIYSCAFDSNSLDMILWPELDLCLFDSTAPHLYEPSRSSDGVIDMYARCVKPGTDEKYASELSDITVRYGAAVKNGTACLREAKEKLDELTDLYSGFLLRDELSRLCETFTHLLKP